MTEPPATWTFAAPAGTALWVAGISSDARIAAGRAGEIAVAVHGDRDYRESVEVTQAEGVIRVIEPPSATPFPPGGTFSGATVSGGSGPGGPGGTSSFAEGMAGGSSRSGSSRSGSSRTGTGGVTVLSVNGRTFVNGADVTDLVQAGGRRGHSVVQTGGRILLNGVDITDEVSLRSRQASAGAGASTGAGTSTGAGAAPGSRAAAEGRTARQVVITVPVGTDVGSDRCVALDLIDVGGWIGAAVSGQSRLTARQATGAKMRVSGQSKVIVTDLAGDTELHVTGQSTVELDGQMSTLSLGLDGQSSVSASGRFGAVQGSASGMSQVILTGTVGRASVQVSGMAAVRVNGRRTNAPPGASWRS